MAFIVVCLFRKKLIEMDDFLKTVENLQIDPKSHQGLLIGIAVVILSISEYCIS